MKLVLEGGVRCIDNGVFLDGRKKTLEKCRSERGGNGNAEQERKIADMTKIRKALKGHGINPAFPLRMTRCVTGRMR